MKGEKKKPQVMANPALSGSFSWLKHLVANPTTTCAPISNFKHSFFSPEWDQIPVGLMVELVNPYVVRDDNNEDVTVYWVARVLEKVGYFIKVRFLGFEDDASGDVWRNFMSKEIHHVGWSCNNRQFLIPPTARVTLPTTYRDWRQFLTTALVGSLTLPTNFSEKVEKALKCGGKFLPGMKLEVVDKVDLSSMRVARINKAIGGRLHLQYCAPGTKRGAATVAVTPSEEDFWCHQRSPLVHPVGWAVTVGHTLNASAQYQSSSAAKATSLKYETSDCTPQLIPVPKKSKDSTTHGSWTVNMKLEAIDPLNLSAISVATVMKVLKSGYLMIGIDGCMSGGEDDLFCYHSTSPCIFPMGFCEQNGIELTPPRNCKKDFKWVDYLKQTSSLPAPVHLFEARIPQHNFVKGMKLESVDLMEPRLVCVATVADVMGRLLKIHFDGWEDKYDQWVDCQSPDIYPIGWCEAAGYKLEGTVQD